MSPAHDTITILVELLLSEQLREVDFFGLYVIVCSQVKFGNRWLGGKLHPPVAIPAVNPIKFCCHKHHSHDYHKIDKERQTIPPATLEQVPILIFLPRGKEYLRTVPIYEIFQNFSIKTLPHFVHESIVLWSLGYRQYKIEFGMPNAIEVLKLMCNQCRCLSLFVTKEELSQTWKDNYPPYEERDSLSFAVHDVKHMEKFVEQPFFEEQIGFFIAMAKILSVTHENNDFITPNYLQYDEQMIFDVEHAISDMNACVFHVFSFLKAKWIAASERTGETKSEFGNKFDCFLEDLAKIAPLSDEVKASMKLVCSSPGFDDAQRIRKYFDSVNAAFPEGFIEQK